MTTFDLPSGQRLSKSEDTRRRIVLGAAAVLVEKGYAATRLSDIAATVGMQAGSLYYHFDSKDDLVEEVLGFGVRYVHEYVRAAVEDLPDGLTAGERLYEAVAAFLDALLATGDLSPAHLRTFHQAPPDMQERLRPGRRDFGHYLDGLISAAVESGDVRSDIEIPVLRLFIINSLERVIDWPESLRERDGRSAVDMMRTLIFDGVRAPR
ncbi:TetR/AcrR family transcriptional regulator [Tsukamurella sp. NPDC003166]|uniref:TetR/AcrR family transcriptional regulator n=1 Tax=Tsukamurella sp. NPDC003166 TaxID=3154444 RepID=UPI0033BD60A3